MNKQETDFDAIIKLMTKEKNETKSKKVKRFLKKALKIYYQQFEKATFTGKLIEYDKPNLNGYTFSKEAVKKMVDDFNEIARDERAVGELYPDSGENTIWLGKISHISKPLELREDGAYGSISTIVGANCAVKVHKIISNGEKKPIFEPRMVGDKILSFDIVGFEDVGSLISSRNK